MDESDDITLLVRKIAKCERLLKKPAAPGSTGSSTSTMKLQKKRSEYLLQLGELAYRAALESPMMLAAGPSPTTVTEKLDPSNFAQFHDSLAIFEHPSMLNGLEEGDETRPDEYNPALLVVEDKVEDQEHEPDAEEPQVKMPATMHRSPELAPLQETTTIATPSETDHEEGIPTGPFDEQDIESFIPQSHTDNDEGVSLETVVNQEKINDQSSIEQEIHPDPLPLPSVGDEAAMPHQERDLPTTEDAMAETMDTDVTDDESLDFLQSTTTADTVQKGEPSQPIDATVTIEPLASKTSDVGPAYDQENSEVVDTVSANLGDATSIHSVETNASEPAQSAPLSIASPSASSSKGSEFDGEGSVSKLRAMFDSPTGEKPRRSWRPKRVFDAVPPAPLVTSEDAAPTKPVPTTVTMRVQEGSDQPQAVITLQQAVMTSSVHDIDSQLVALVSLFPESLHAYLPKQNRALLIFHALGIEPQYVDGSNPDERERRDELFRLSGKRGVYPQLFVRKQGKLEFFADFDRIELLNDCDTLKDELEAACRQDP